MTRPWFLSRPIAHRGLHHGTEVPENSLAAFEAACEAGYPIELDCHYHATSGKIVVFHDEDLTRMVGDPRNLQEVELTELINLRLYESEQKIPTLAEVLNLVNGRVPLLIETKLEHSDGKFEEALMAHMQNYTGEWAIQSFHHFSLYWFERHHPHVVKGMLAGSMEGAQIPSWKRIGVKALAMLPLIKPQFVAYEARELVRRGKGLPWQRALGVPVIAWTLRSYKEYKAVRELCDNVIFENFTPE